MTAIIWPARSAVQPVGRTKLHIGGRRDATGTPVRRWLSTCGCDSPSSDSEEPHQAP